jgi:hypothetical protein
MTSAQTLDRLQRHVLDVAKEHDITVRYCGRTDKAVSFRELDEIVIPRIRSEISYATAMHELGHMLADSGTALAPWCESGGHGVGRNGKLYSGQLEWVGAGTSH